MQSPNDNSSVNSQIIDWSQFVPGSDEAVITDVLLNNEQPLGFECMSGATCSY